jgi:hypothetical protein
VRAPKASGMSNRRLVELSAAALVVLGLCDLALGMYDLAPINLAVAALVLRASRGLQ